MNISLTKKYLKMTFFSAATLACTATYADNHKVIVDSTTPDSVLLSSIDKEEAYELKRPFTALRVSITSQSNDATLSVRPMETEDSIVLINESDNKLSEEQRSSIIATASKVFTSDIIIVAEEE